MGSGESLWGPYEILMGLGGSLCGHKGPYVVLMGSEGSLWGPYEILMGFGGSLWGHRCPYGVLMGSGDNMGSLWDLIESLWGQGRTSRALVGASWGPCGVGGGGYRVFMGFLWGQGVCRDHVGPLWGFYGVLRGAL